MEHRTEALVVGGGPAGSSAALELARNGCAVILVEKTNLENIRIGEMLPPGVKPLLKQLGVFDRFLKDCHSVSRGICSVWGVDAPQHRDFIFNPHGHGWHLDRRKFDSLLLGAAEDSGAKILRQARIVSVLEDRNHMWSSLVTQGNNTLSIRSNLIIDATGRSAWIAKCLGATHKLYDMLIGFAVLFEADACDRILEPITLIESSEQGWWYSVPLPSRRLIVVYMTDVDLYARAHREKSSFWFERIQETTHTLQRIKGLRSVSRPRGFMANTYVLNDLTNSNCLPVGSAVVGLDPLSSDGICFAIRSGLDAARCFLTSNGNGRTTLEGYFSEIKTFFSNYLRERSACYSWETRWRNSAFWQRRQYQEIQETGSRDIV